MFTLKIFARAAVLSVLVAAAGGAQAQSAYDDDVQELLGTIKAFQVMEGMFETVKPTWERQILKAFPKMPEDVRKIFVDEMAAGFLAERENFNAQVVDIYKSYFSHDDIKQALAFYRTPTGQKMAHALPVVARETKDAALKWGQAVGPAAGRAAVQKLVGLGYDLNSFR